tara:strand:+ start:1017 stop:1526 length:510 start_codon:yes stop_codon:yes gene_type:complete
VNAEVQALIERHERGTQESRPEPKTDHCRAHARVPLGERSIDCPLCAADMRSMMVAALNANRELFEWQTAMVRALRHGSPEKEPSAELRSEPDADTVSDNLDLPDGSWLAFSQASADQSHLTIMHGRPPLRDGLDAEVELLDYVRVQRPTHASASLAAQLLAQFFDSPR